MLNGWRLIELIDDNEEFARNLAKKVALTIPYNMVYKDIIRELKDGTTVREIEEYWSEFFESNKIDTKEKHMKTVVCLKTGEIFELMDVETRLLDTLSDTGERLRVFTNKETRESLLCNNLDIRYIWKYEVED